MDYKKRNPGPHLWRVDDCIKNFDDPYDLALPGTVMEVVPPDRSTTFLLVSRGIDEERSTVRHFGVEAPRDYPLRIAFENSEVAWLDFWGHRGWMIHVECPLFTRGIAEITYATSVHIDPWLLDVFKKLGSTGPYERKLLHLEKLVEYAEPGTELYFENEKSYRMFVQKHAKRVENYYRKTKDQSSGF